jgi:DNA-binding transcriptional MocR family regulator
MAQRDILLAFLREHPDHCDDCLSDTLGIHPRQTINQRARELAEQGLIVRTERACAGCGKPKLVNRPPDRQAPASPTIAHLEPGSWAAQLANKAFERGLEEGFELARREGIAQEQQRLLPKLRRLLLLSLQSRFGTLPDPAVRVIEHASEETLDRIYARLVASTLEDILR